MSIKPPVDPGRSRHDEAKQPESGAWAPSGAGLPEDTHAHKGQHAHAHVHGRDSARGHGLGHSHSHGPHATSSLTGSAGSRRAFLIGIVLNLTFVALEAGFGFSSHSLSLIADAGHNFGDVISLILAGGAMLLAQRSPSAQFTYGLRGSTILAALGNAMILLVVTGAIVWASIERFRVPVAVASTTVVMVAGVGVVVNGATALLFHTHRHDDLNARGAFLHMAGDAAVSVGVIFAALTMRYTGWLWIDPAVGIVVALIILAGTWDLLKQSLRLAMQAVPENIDAGAVRSYIESRPGVVEVHDLHIWAMSTTETAMTVHLVMPAGHPGDAFLDHVARDLDAQFHVSHATLQVETGGAGGRICSLACETVTSLGA